MGRICKDCFTDDEVFRTRVITERETFEENDEGYVLKLPIPYVEKKDIDLYQSSTDVVIKINNFKRSIPLPNVLRTYQITSAKYENGALNLQFKEA